jgi:hypothetical protein
MRVIGCSIRPIRLSGLAISPSIDDLLFLESRFKGAERTALRIQPDAQIRSFQDPVPIPLIVASRLADDKLWAEVLNLGGSDVLALRFDHDEVIRSVSLAWREVQDPPTHSAALHSRQKGVFQSSIIIPNS